VKRDAHRTNPQGKSVSRHYASRALGVANSVLVGESTRQNLPMAWTGSSIGWDSPLQRLLRASGETGIPYEPRVSKHLTGPPPRIRQGFGKLRFLPPPLLRLQLGTAAVSSPTRSMR
jgi:hypothetical protein